MKISSFHELYAQLKMNDILDFVHFTKCKKYLEEILKSLPKMPCTKVHEIHRISNIFIEYCRMYGYEYDRFLDDDRGLYTQAYSIIALIALFAFNNNAAKAIAFICKHHKKEVYPWNPGYPTDNIDTDEIISVLEDLRNPTEEQREPTRLLTKAMRLSSASLNTININENAEKAFITPNNFKKEALAMLPIKEYREEARNLWDIIPNYFWSCPSSATGKYHTRDECEKGGNILHTLRDMKVFMSLCKAENIEDKLFITEGLFALLFHDSIKQGWSRTGSQTCFDHPLLAGKLVRSHAHIIKENSRERIAKAINSHNGRFATSRYYEGELPTPQTQLEILVHEADFIASRRQFHINI